MWLAELIFEAVICGSMVSNINGEARYSIPFGRKGWHGQIAEDGASMVAGTTAFNTYDHRQQHVMNLSIC